MYEVTVEAGFSSGHYLRNYRGKCENPHGHNYKVRVTLAGAALDEAGLLLDFKLLKHVMRPVIDRIDHQMLNDLEPFTVLNPSAENIAKYFYDQTNEQLAEMTQGRARKRLHHLGDGHHHGYVLRVDAFVRGACSSPAARRFHESGSSSPSRGGSPFLGLRRISSACCTFARSAL
jgi:6-pyruvoyltetrahydropterin/6-carboxytetrahydropterin synthase